MSEKIDNNAVRLMSGRLGVYDKYKSMEDILDAAIQQGIYGQNIRMDYRGGSVQQTRMINDKKRSLARALLYSYQGADVIKTSETKSARALINPNKLKQDYDDKIISIYYDYGYTAGDVFEWIGTNTYWLIYLQDLTELAYFRGDIRKCSHEIAWEDEDGQHSTYAAIRGPVETKINYIQKHGISIDTPNYSLNILMPKSEAAIKYFQRYQKFYLKGDKDYKVCWRVEAVDWLSMPGIIEINAVEYYSNETEDDIENGVVGGLIAEPVDPNIEAENFNIEGETFIKPKKEYEYTCNSDIIYSWVVSNGAPVKLEPSGKTVKLKWNATTSGQFDLIYGDIYKKTIVVESLF